MVVDTQTLFPTQIDTEYGAPGGTKYIYQWDNEGGGTGTISVQWAGTGAPDIAYVRRQIAFRYPSQFFDSTYVPPSIGSVLDFFGHPGTAPRPSTGSESGWIYIVIAAAALLFLMRK